MKLLLAIPLGLFFGFALYYVGATKRENIINMLRLRNLSLAKIILGAIGFGSIIIGFLSMLNLIPIEHFNIKTLHLGVIIGGMIFGIGFGLIGSCPGTALASLFTNFKKSIWIILGGLLGAFSFSNIYELINKLSLINGFNLGELTLFHIVPDNPAVLSISFSGMILFGSVLLIIALILPIRLLEDK